MSKLLGKTALITGGSEGLGFAIAKLFVEQGARVAIFARTQEKLDTATAAIDGDVLTISGDVSRLDDLDTAVATVGEAFGGLDILVCNAGVAKNMPVHNVDEAYYDWMMGINLKGLFFTVQKSLPIMRSPGTIILLSSVTNTLGLKGTSIYAASKAAVRSFSRTLCNELADKGIRVNTVSPAVTMTPLVERLLENPESKARMDTLVNAKTPLKRLGRPEEVARAVLFLASEDSSYTTGSELFVDGGMGQI